MSVTTKTFTLTFSLHIQLQILLDQMDEQSGKAHLTVTTQQVCCNTLSATWGGLQAQVKLFNIITAYCRCKKVLKL